MLKKDSSIKWTVEAKQAFEEIKMALTRTPVLTSPQFDRDFIIFSFASKYTITMFYYKRMAKNLKNL